VTNEETTVRIAQLEEQLATLRDEFESFKLLVIEKAQGL
jgi:hypothetical protein